jgi:hypothetical protein
MTEFIVSCSLDISPGSLRNAARCTEVNLDMAVLRVQSHGNHISGVYQRADVPGERRPILEFRGQHQARIER